MPEAGGGTVFFRGARHDDAVGLQEFCLELDRPTGSEFFPRSCIDDPGRRIVVALMDARIIGWAKSRH